ncbi:TPA: hypothetical protein ACHC9S_001408 [Streptococcus pyogenes]|nr:hypothetical protein [Streptococcus pyogenes]ESU92163.1 hypothetical protein HMPREF1244_0060 [Streptococcus pyogenes GA19702]
MKKVNQSELRKISGGSALGLNRKTTRPPRTYLSGPVKPKLEIM